MCSHHVFFGNQDVENLDKLGFKKKILPAQSFINQIYFH